MARLGGEVLDRWPHIRRYLHLKVGMVDDDFLDWTWHAEDGHSPAELAVSYEEWADFWEWLLELRADELAGDRVKRHLVAKWTDSMAYCCRRSATWARGDDPGEWIPQWERRPDLDAEGRAIVAEIVAGLDARSQPADATTRHLRKAG